jgi:hypothetical protein
MFLSHAIDVVKVQLYHVACVAFSFVMIVVNQMKMTIQFALIVLLMNVSRVYITTPRIGDMPIKRLTVKLSRHLKSSTSAMSTEIKINA